MRVTVKVTFIATPGNKTALENTLRPSLEVAVLPKECVSAMILHHSAPDEVVIVEEWSSAEAHEAYYTELIRLDRLRGIRHLFSKISYSYTPVT